MFTLWHFFVLILNAVVCLGSWYPLPTEQKPAGAFRLVDAPGFQSQFLSDLTGKLPSLGDLQWTETTMFAGGREKNSKRNAWLIVAGTAPRDEKYAASAYTKKAGAVAACELVLDSDTSAGFKLDSCNLLDKDLPSNDSDVGLLGTGLRSLEIPESGEGVVVYCNPLWHTKLQTHSPGGKCYIKSRRNNNWFTREIDFCNSGGRTLPCAGGFSVDLKVSDDMKDGVKLLAGLPFVPEYGRAQVINIPRFGSNFQRTDINSDKEGFGTAVAFIPQSLLETGSLAVVSTPSVMETPSVYGYSLTSHSRDFIAPLFQISPPETNDEAKFSGFGTVVETVQLSDVERSAVVLVGAPYEKVAGIGTNVGRVYLYCQDSANANLSHLVGTIKGTREGEMMGYAISRLADVDGDGIKDVAISAPAIVAPNSISGRVYIYRILPDCSIDENPFQTLEASPSGKGMQPPAGFGISVSRGADIDYDGGSELAITTLDPNVPVLLYSMPQNMKAACTFSAQPKELNIKNIHSGSTVSVFIAIRLMDPRTGKLHNVPKGLASRNVRLHQLNTDFLWTERFNYVNSSKNRSAIDEFFASFFGSSIDVSQSRFELDGDLDVNLQNSDRLMVKAKLRARVSGESMDLEAVPLRIAYQSTLLGAFCGAFNAEMPECKKSEQPVVDWSDCKWEMNLTKPFCVPRPTCHGDIGPLIWKDGSGNQIPANGSESRLKVLFTEPKQSVRLVVANNGPDKSNGIRVYLSAIGLPQNDTDFGIHLKFTSIIVKTQLNGEILGSHGPLSDGIFGRKTWSVLVSDNEAAVLIRSKPDTFLYPNDAVVVDIDCYLDGLRLGYERQDNGGDNTQISKLGIHARVQSATYDPDPKNNLANLLFRINYEPRVVINPGVALTTIIDEHKKAPLAESINSRMVLGHDLGPRLSHQFLVENSGKIDLKNLTFELDIPIQTADGHILLYLVDRARILKNDEYTWIPTLPRAVSDDGKPVGFCHIDPKYVNPLNIIIRDQASKEEPKYRRARRSADSTHFVEGDEVLDVYFKRSCSRQAVLTCSSKNVDKKYETIKVECAKVICNIARLAQMNTVRFHLTGWLWAASFFKLHLPDVRFVTKLTLKNWGALPTALKLYSKDVINLNFSKLPPAYEMAQSIVFRGATGRHTDHIPLWPIITGVAAGSILLFGLVALLYFFGFFQRRRKTQAAREKVRKSMRNDSLRRDLFLDDDLTKKSSFAKNGRHSGESPNLICAPSPQPPSPAIGTEDTNNHNWFIHSQAEAEKAALLPKASVTTYEPENDKKELPSADAEKEKKEEKQLEKETQKKEDILDETTNAHKEHPQK